MHHLFAFGLGGQELWIILIVILVLFGGKKIPELMRGVGKGVGELQRGIDEGKSAIDKARYSSSNDDDADPKPGDADGKQPV